MKRKITKPKWRADTKHFEWIKKSEMKKRMKEWISTNNTYKNNWNAHQPEHRKCFDFRRPTNNNDLMMRIIWMGCAPHTHLCMEIISITDHRPSSDKPQFGELLYTKRYHSESYANKLIFTYNSLLTRVNSDKLWVFLFYPCLF